MHDLGYRACGILGACIDGVDRYMIPLWRVDFGFVKFFNVSID